MNRNIKIILLIAFALCFIFFIGCEGPAGADGADGANGADGFAGADGVDGNVSCLVCHSDENLEMKKHEFAMSTHSAGPNVAYAGGRGSCSRCHSHEGFVAFAEGFDAENIANPSPWECSTCHGLHQTFESEDYALRLTDAVSIWDGGNFLLKGNNYLEIQGNSNLCANCHQSRRPEPAIDVPGETFNITSTHYGPHHGSQANVLAGVGFAEIVGSVTYPTAGSSYHIAASCTGCHMAEFDGEGGHSFTPSLSACNVCHTTSDFNYGSVQAEIDGLLDDLRDLLVAAGVVEQGHEDIYEINQETGVIELVSYAGEYHPVVGTHSMVHARAFFNWVGLEEDRSAGVHNPKYVKALIKNSIDAM